MPTNTPDQINFTVNKENLYREESITDLTAASIRQLLPVNVDGTPDKSRTTVFVGFTQLMSPQGPLPVQCQLAANNLAEAIEMYPAAMEKELAKLIAQVEKMQREQKTEDDSRIIVPGR
ncbi:MAG: cytoplasmic protein [Desulfobacterales bacterium]|jgi:hypothetical protein